MAELSKVWICCVLQRNKIRKGIFWFEHVFSYHCVVSSSECSWQVCRRPVPELFCWCLILLTPVPFPLRHFIYTLYSIRMGDIEFHWWLDEILQLQLWSCHICYLYIVEYATTNTKQRLECREGHNTKLPCPVEWSPGTNRVQLKLHLPEHYNHGFLFLFWFISVTTEHFSLPVHSLSHTYQSYKSTGYIYLVYVFLLFSSSKQSYHTIRIVMDSIQ